MSFNPPYWCESFAYSIYPPCYVLSCNKTKITNKLISTLIYRLVHHQNLWNYNLNQERDCAAVLHYHVRLPLYLKTDKSLANIVFYCKFRIWKEVKVVGFIWWVHMMWLVMFMQLANDVLVRISLWNICPTALEFVFCQMENLGGVWWSILPS